MSKEIIALTISYGIKKSWLNGLITIRKRVREYEIPGIETESTAHEMYEDAITAALTYQNAEEIRKWRF